MNARPAYELCICFMFNVLLLVENDLALMKYFAGINLDLYVCLTIFFILIERNPPRRRPLAPIFIPSCYNQVIIHVDGLTAGLSGDLLWKSGRVREGF